MSNPFAKNCGFMNTLRVKQFYFLQPQNTVPHTILKKKKEQVTCSKIPYLVVQYLVLLNIMLLTKNNYLIKTSKR